MSLKEKVSKKKEEIGLETRYRRLFAHGGSVVLTLPKRMRVVLGVGVGCALKLELDRETREITITRAN